MLRAAEARVFKVCTSGWNRLVEAKAEESKAYDTAGGIHSKITGLWPT